MLCRQTSYYIEKVDALLEPRPLPPGIEKEGSRVAVEHTS